MSAVAMIDPKFYAWDENGKPLAGGKVYTYETGTTTNKTTWTDETQTTANANPVILNSEGYADIYLDGSYSIVVKDSNDVLVWSEDPVSSAQPEGWVLSRATTYVSTTSFTVVGNYTDDFTKDRAIRIDNNTGTYSYSHISSSSFSGGVTTVVITDAVVTTGVIFAAVSIIVAKALPSNLDSILSVLDVYNNTGSTITANSLVYAGNWNTGAEAIEVALADADGSGTYPVIGIVTANIANGAKGSVATSGVLKNLNTSSFNDGDLIYMSSTPGAYTTTRPLGLTEKVQAVARVLRSHATQGMIEITGAGRVNDVPNNSAMLDAKQTFTKTQIWSKGADVASASALTLGDDGNYFDITGTTTVTSIATKGIGTVVRLHFDGVLVLTHHASDLILPTGANITTAAGDEAEFIEYASGDWRCVSYTRASGKPLSGDMLESADIGVTVQAYDADTTKNDVANTFTADQTFNTAINASAAGIELGGTGSANTLDDYEEGTWTPNISSLIGWVGAVTVHNAKYTKTGREVTINASISFPSSTGNVAAGDRVILTGLPFVPSDQNAVALSYNFNDTNGALMEGLIQTSSTVRINVNNVRGAPTRSGGGIDIMCSYFV